MKTVEEIAKLLNVSETYIRRMCREGFIRCTKHGRDWLILDVTKEAIQSFHDIRLEQNKKLRSGKTYIKTVYRARKKKGSAPRPKVSGKKRKYEDWESRSPSQKWDWVKDEED